jgi:predicted negative regulator of RcsB-dependent stress response
MFMSLRPTRWWWSRSANGVIVAIVLSAGSWFGVAAVRAQQAGAQTVHETPVPRITTSGQADWPLHSLDVYGSR